jgi:hypothetical protein
MPANPPLAYQPTANHVIDRTIQRNGTMPGLIFARSLLVVGVLAGPAWAPSNAQVTMQPKASVPDFSSNMVGWVNINPDFVPVPGAPAPTRNDPAYPYVGNQEARRAGIQPTFRVADLSNPNLKPWAKEIMKRENDKVLAGGIAYTPRSSCMPAGVPLFLMFPVAEPIYFIQTPKQVRMIFVGDAQVRRIYLDVPHSANPKPSWYGESVGRYEGDTLIVDTIGLNNKTYLDNYRTPHTEKLHVVEQWKLIDDTTLGVTLTVDDPDTFYQPWMATHRYRRIPRPGVHEEVCAENNQSLFDYGIPVANKPDF